MNRRKHQFWAIQSIRQSTRLVNLDCHVLVMRFFGWSVPKSTQKCVRIHRKWQPNGIPSMAMPHCILVRSSSARVARDLRILSTVPSVVANQSGGTELEPRSYGARLLCNNLGINLKMWTFSSARNRDINPDYYYGWWFSRVLHADASLLCSPVRCWRVPLFDTSGFLTSCPLP